MPLTDSSFPRGTGLGGTPETLPLSPSTLETRNGALSQPLALELAQCGENCELESPAGGAEVQTFLQRHERNVQRLEILEHRQKVFQIPANPIQGPAHDYLEPRATCLEEQPIKAWPPILHAADFVGVFGVNAPAPRFAVATELEELVFRSRRSTARPPRGQLGEVCIGALSLCKRSRRVRRDDLAGGCRL
jgi:hypothetical protein